MNRPGGSREAYSTMLSMRNYVLMTSLDPKALRIIGEESKRKGTDKLTTRQIEEVIKSLRAAKTKRG
jgi:hypothetical protein